MCMNNVGGIILGGGYGTITKGVSKLVESVGLIQYKPLISCVSDIFQDLGIVATFIVVNNSFGAQIRGALPKCSGQFIVQSKRVGNGGAVKLCLPYISLLEIASEKNIESIVVLYGDMPLWRPTTISMLIESHQSTSSVVSMFSIALGENCPQAVGRYGRILRDRRGKIIGIREPFELTEEEKMATYSVNPSAWVFDRRWLESNISLLRPHQSHDGFPPELWLPDLVTFAYEQDLEVNELELSEPWQALGVNTAEELAEVRSIWSSYNETAFA